jgi:hypothetical protein
MCAKLDFMYMSFKDILNSCLQTGPNIREQTKQGMI